MSNHFRTRFSRKQWIFLSIATLPLITFLMCPPWRITGHVHYRYPDAPAQQVLLHPIEWTWLWEAPPPLPPTQGQPPRVTTYTRRIVSEAWIQRLFPAALVVVITYLLLIHETRAWRWNRGRCEQCGYDIKSGGQTTCPECGCVRS